MAVKTARIMLVDKLYCMYNSVGFIYRQSDSVYSLLIALGGFV